MKNYYETIFKKLLDKNCIESINNISWPSEKLNVIKFNDDFNENIDGLVFPDGINTINFGNSFNQPIDNIQFPKFLRNVYFGNNFNKKIDVLADCHYLNLLHLGNSFNQHIENLKLSDEVENIYIGHTFNKSIENFYIPKNLKYLEIGNSFDQDINNLKFTYNLDSLTLGKSFNKSLKNITINTHTYLILKKANLNTINNLPDNLKYLIIENLNYPLLNLPEALVFLEVMDFYYDLHINSKIPCNCILKVTSKRHYDK
jgi:hypothetical protein